LWILRVLTPFLQHFENGIKGEMSSPTVIGQTRLDINQEKELCKAKMQHAKLSQKVLIEMAKKKWGLNHACQPYR